MESGHVMQEHPFGAEVKDFEPDEMPFLDRSRRIVGMVNEGWARPVSMEEYVQTCTLRGIRQPRARFLWRGFPFAELWLPLNTSDAANGYVFMATPPGLPDTYHMACEDGVIVSHLVDFLRGFLAGYHARHAEHSAEAEEVLDRIGWKQPNPRF